MKTIIATTITDLVRRVGYAPMHDRAHATVVVEPSISMDLAAAHLRMRGWIVEVVGTRTLTIK